MSNSETSAPWALAQRRLTEALWKAFRLSIEQKRQRYFAKHGFDIGELPIAELKASTVSRDPAKIKLVLAHVTDVTGGFGLAKYQLDSARKTIRLEGFPIGVARQLMVAYDARVDGTLNMDHMSRMELNKKLVSAYGEDDLVEILAAWLRYRNTPYHGIATPSGHALLNRPLTQRSYHGGPYGNDGAGFGTDCGNTEVITDWHVETAYAGLSQLVILIASHGDADREIILVPHRAVESTRRNDTNQETWRKIYKPTVDELYRSGAANIRIDYEYKRDGGLQIPNVWDRDALYDSRGKRL